MIRVLLVHDSRLLRSALTTLLGREKDLEVRGASWRAAVGQTRSLRPHVCVVDVDCPGAAMIGTLIGLARRATGPASALLVLATGTRPGLLRRAFDAGALGYVSKDAGPQRLLEGIRRVAAGPPERPGNPAPGPRPAPRGGPPPPRKSPPARA
ncbi:response regulator transcription factor, partial [Streptomyces sp. NPDC059544]|uniref:response regulator n=1 Tax=Streptomyces sp. NPDC059544 TaxID=3346861 RepID=UPI0036C11961